MNLIVGLGNPGDQYEHTRHNVGFDVLTLLSEKTGIRIHKIKGHAVVGEGLAGGEKVMLCKPQTYMNNSGLAVRELMDFYKLAPENLLVIYDDVDLAPGAVRVRPSGSAGTHNGMRSIVEQLGTMAFPRIRVGIGERAPGYELADWVLSRYHTAQERQTAFDAYQQAADAAIAWVEKGIEVAMRDYNTKKKPKAEVKPDE
ncbi:MAG: aminoacyl-tRNA hydrolase [Clostridia bacterium]|nr:aminoacyl-tRNA hydrolase [Clostridia bacterium]